MAVQIYQGDDGGHSAYFMGGPLHNQRKRFRDRPPHVWRVPIAPEPMFYADFDPTRVAHPRTCDYLRVGRDGHGVWIYCGEEYDRYLRRGRESEQSVSSEVWSRAMRDVVALLSAVSVDMFIQPETGLEPDITQDYEERPASQVDCGYAFPARMDGKRVYPLDAIKAEETRELIVKIDEVTDES